ncbi:MULTISPECIES: hypothetical protein [Stenotrophomonas maltophilia group]|mgnify:CR=1 FL=1|jgi:hypothetical protein|uniref:Uncharacterized protein n=1 Tax=Stenotrophomonas maltophilia TaxID=40324 RepID=A0A246IA19_STEMA|nr:MULTISPECIES: hypothetical protein [Stenotrophomonas maltophilia group]MBA0273345.1 hypothetical protein [Stenotrophomonas maltophilia]MCZ7844677.1 hypothetical protein [Stenotrophomonas maltophilia]MDJ1623862.1 hypothetical protein [Stenotrophomonas sepilia]MDT3490034.1 hypothetical protein [Stenotrophomonas maltophilia group sp. msm4]OWQ76112.1 hypothetical protein CEE63_07185 [Stenotrophomonas maltophilia]
MRAVALVGLALAAGPVLAAPPAPPSAWLERQQAAGADEANAAGAKASTRPEARERCRVTKEWKVGETVVQHRVCEDPPKKPAGKV